MKKEPYFERQLAMDAAAGSNDELVLAAVAGRFIGANPKHPPVYRAHTTAGFKRGRDYRYDMDIGARWPQMADGELVYVWGKLWSDHDAESPFSISCYAPAVIYINEAIAFKSNLNDDVFPERRTYFRSSLRKGWNDIVLEFTSTGTGCGAVFGTGSVKGFPMHVLSPLPERSGQEGWVYSLPQKDKWPVLPGAKDHSTFSECWYPELKWSPEEAERGCFARILGEQTPLQTAFAWTKFEQRSLKPLAVKLEGRHHGRCSIYLDGERIWESSEHTGEIAISISVAYGGHDLLVQSESCGPQWGFTLNAVRERETEPQVIWSLPFPVQGISDHWLYAGVFDAETLPTPEQIMTAHPDLMTKWGLLGWQADMPKTWVRPYLENHMYGKWNYPLGVTLYGILRTGEALGVSYYSSYALDHIEQCSALFEVGLQEAERFGSPGINHQLTLTDSLDDCGSFGAAMLEADKLRPLKGADAAAKHIAHYIIEEQDRLPDGALYRTRGTTDFMKDTMWCDDLYMSTPFLAKYYERTKEVRYLDDAAEQFLLYRSRLFIPGLQIMHHVYDFKFEKPNGVAWGRGNGWVIFSLSELLAILPVTHKHYAKLLAFFQELCQGYILLQDEDGMWHQILTDHESYAEASCTSMFIYAFARGVRYGWLPENAAEQFANSALRAWQALKRDCIDKHGHVYGVCRGSGYSHSAAYYKDELSWQLDDTHGIGIVLLAGMEAIRLREYLVNGRRAVSI